jgi:hypothetical protein
LPLKSSSFIAAPLDVLSLRLTSLGFSASLVNPTAHDVSFSEHSMSDFKQLSRSVAGLTVLVTGAASGMGRATARVFAAEGAKVAVTDFTAEGAQAVVKEIAETGGTAKAWTLQTAMTSTPSSTTSLRISAGSTLSSTTPAFRYAWRSMMIPMTKPGPRDWRFCSRRISA